MFPPFQVVLKYWSKMNILSSCHETLHILVPGYRSSNCLCVVIERHCHILWVAVDIDVLGRTVL